MSVTKLDALLSMVGELVVAHGSTEQQLGELGVLVDELGAWEARWRQRRGHSRAARARELPEQGYEEDWLRLRSARSRVVALHRLLRASARRSAELTSELDDEVRRSRMLPVSTVLDGFPRMVRDIARQEAKEIALGYEGGATEVDRSLLEALRAPLIHLVRNCIDHGVETPDARVGAGKPRQGTITIGVEQRGGSLVIDISDDGAGIDVPLVRDRALQRGLITPASAELLGERDVIELIFRPGFSTARIITDLSGRGVGLAVVRESIERLHGVIEVESRLGAGTRFELRLPLSVATTPCLLLGVHGQAFALPTTNVARVARLTPQAVARVAGRPVLRDGASFVPLVRLSAVLGLDDGPLAASDEPRPVVLVDSGQQRMAFQVDALVGLRDVVTKALPAPLVRVRHLSGATILGTGEIATILNALDLLRAASPMRDAEEGPAGHRTRRPVVLLAEDSPTTRTLQRRMLERAGYEVRAVGDGAQAWSLLREGGIDVVVTDVRMPGMDGLELTTRIRADQALRRLPVILVTSTDRRADRDRGVAAGADAYIVKGTLEQQHLVESVKRVVRGA